jgi:hypothetical protein
VATVFIEIRDTDDGNVSVQTKFVPPPKEGEEMTTAQSIAYTLLQEMRKKTSGEPEVPPLYQHPRSF